MTVTLCIFLRTTVYRSNRYQKRPTEWGRTFMNGIHVVNLHMDTNVLCMAIQTKYYVVICGFVWILHTMFHLCISHNSTDRPTKSMDYKKKRNAMKKIIMKNEK